MRLRQQLQSHLYNDDEYILPSFGFDTGRIARSQELSSDEPSSDVAPAYVNYIDF